MLHEPSACAAAMHSAARRAARAKTVCVRSDLPRTNRFPKMQKHRICGFLN